MDNRALFHIRFNHLAENEQQRWKLFFNGEEWWVANIIIDGICSTTKDWLPKDNDYKWHMTVYGTCQITPDNIAYITSATPDSENRKFRHLLKAISYTCAEAIICVGALSMLNPSLEAGIYSSAGYIAFRVASFYVHERIWHNKVKLKK